MNCKCCGADLTPDEIGATKRFVNRASTEFMCLDCLSKHLDCKKEYILERIEFFRKSGCLLFPPKEEDK